MNADLVFRAAAVAAAVVLVGAPYWSVVAQAGIRLAEAAYNAAKARKAVIARTAAAGLIVAAAWGKVPLPSFEAVTVPRVEVVTPSDEMQRVVTPIADALKASPMGSRILWSQVWSKAAVVVAGDAITTEVVFTDTKSLRAFTVIALDIAWRRLAGNQPGQYPGLREATEAAFAEVIGKAEVGVTKDLRERYAELCRAIAWAGVGKG